MVTKKKQFRIAVYPLKDSIRATAGVLCHPLSFWINIRVGMHAEFGLIAKKKKKKSLLEPEPTVKNHSSRICAEFVSHKAECA